MQEWSIFLQESINQTLGSGTFSLTVLSVAFLLGLVSSVSGAICSLPVLGAVVGLSGSQKAKSYRTNLIAAISFMLGAIIAIIILGSVAGFISQIAQATLGKYWKLFAGLIVIILGLGTLDLLPFNLSVKSFQTTRKPKQFFGVAIFGLGIGGAISVCSLGCNPGIYILLGVVVLQGYSLWATSMLAAYAVGFSLPLTAIMLGISTGAMAIKAKKIETAIRVAAGIFLIVAGFYFLSTM